MKAPVIVAILGCAAFSLDRVGMCQIQETSRLEARLQAADPIFATGDEALLLLSLHSRESNCDPTYFDPLLVPEPFDRSSLRPFSLLELEILNEDGQPVPTRRLPTPDYMALMPKDLTRINCRMFAGWEIHLTRSPWYYVLGKGRYRARGTVLLRTLSFAKSWPSFLAEFARSRSLPPEYDAARLLGEGRFPLGETSFEIVGER
jgi:hypothetical protein